ncbi:MAG: ferric reductase-like transmembrane domain-containing protein [Pseudomonadota bacterium]
MTSRLSFLHPWWLWALFALPAAGLISAATTSDDPDVLHELLHPTGEFSARFMILAMLATPLSMWLKGWRGPAWLRRNRRYLGVAAFGYAALHTLFYLLDAASLSKVIEEAPRLYIWTGWLAFAIFLPLAATSTDRAVRAMGPAWKALQRWVYAAAVLTLLHWAALHDWGGIGPALVHFGPLAALEAWRFRRWVSRAQPSRA